MEGDCGETLDIELLENNYFDVIEEEVEDFSFMYCVSYRDPSRPEWILARGYWNNLGVWIDEEFWYDS